jgi:hypothetical protein
MKPSPFLRYIIVWQGSGEKDASHLLVFQFSRETGGNRYKTVKNAIQIITGGSVPGNGKS